MTPFNFIITLSRKWQGKEQRLCYDATYLVHYWSIQRKAYDRLSQQHLQSYVRSCFAIGVPMIVCGDLRPE